MRILKTMCVLAGCCLVAAVAGASIDHGTLGVADTATVTNILQLTENAEDDEIQCWGPYPWSADGQRIVYTSEVDADDYMENEICVIGADGTGWQRLTNNSTCDSHANFTPDGRIVFQRYTDPPGYGHIWIMNGNGSGQVDLTEAHGGPVNGSGTCENKPRVSPDGAKIAFHTCDEDIWVMNIDGSNPVKVSGSEDDCVKYEWSPDSRWLYFNAYYDSYVDIYRAAADGSELIALTDLEDSTCTNWPSPSPNGAWVSYHDDDGCIWLMAPNGSNKSMLYDGSTSSAWGPTSWSPNSEWVAYYVSDELFIVHVGTLEVRQLTTGYDDYRHWWSPDGSCILFRDDGGTTRDGATLSDDLLVVNLATAPLFAFQQQAGIPTLGSLGTMLLVLLTAGAGVFALRRWLA